VIAGDQRITAQTNCRSKDGAVFFRKPVDQASFRAGRLCGAHMEALEQSVKLGQCRRLFRGEIPARFIHDVFVNSAIMSVLEQQMQ